MENNKNWLGDLLMNLAPGDIDLSGKSPDEMIKSASWKSFAVSTASGLAPGPAGWVTILPEIIAVTKIQINLVYAIAKHYGQTSKFNSGTVMLIFANEAGIAVRGVAAKVGEKLIVRALSSKAAAALSQRIGVKIGARVTQRVVGRWVPVVLAPVFGAFSKSMTAKIGREAVKLFSSDFEVVEIVLCPNGHEASDDSKFCPECGAPMAVKE
jgi:uncharacterized protein (DUF697 family)